MLEYMIGQLVTYILSKTYKGIVFIDMDIILYFPTSLELLEFL